jgi:hypothetical protein
MEANLEGRDESASRAAHRRQSRRCGTEANSAARMTVGRIEAITATTTRSSIWVRRLAPMHISRLLAGVVIAVLLPGNAIAGALDDCAAAFDRHDYAAATCTLERRPEARLARSSTPRGGLRRLYGRAISADARVRLVCARASPCSARGITFPHRIWRDNLDENIILIVARQSHLAPAQRLRHQRPSDPRAAHYAPTCPRFVMGSRSSRISELAKTRIPKRFGLDPIRDVQGGRTGGCQRTGRTRHRVLLGQWHSAGPSSGCNMGSQGGGAGESIRADLSRIFVRAERRRSAGLRPGAPCG